MEDGLAKLVTNRSDDELLADMNHMVDMMRERLAVFLLIVRASGCFRKKRKAPEGIRRLIAFLGGVFC